MYTNLISAMAQKGITVESIAKLIGAHRNTVHNKLHGDSDFTYQEAMMIGDTMFPEYKSSYLFIRTDPKVS